MILIADSGSTKTEWRVLSDDNQVFQIKTKGINPYYENTQAITKLIQEEVAPRIKSKIKTIYFYGAGCSLEDKQLIVKKALKKVFSQASIQVYHDLLGSARALCGNQPGIVGILGTGSNANVYDGKRIVSAEQNLGFILGDEGSGAYMGKKLIQDFLHQELPPNLMDRFSKQYTIDRKEVLEQVYKKPFPNRYMAAFNTFLFDNLREPYCYRLVYNSFSEFMDKYVCKIENHQVYKIYFSGSIAFFYSHILKQVINDKDMMLGNILQHPIKGLTSYHQKIVV